MISREQMQDAVHKIVNGHHRSDGDDACCHISAREIVEFVYEKLLNVPEFVSFSDAVVLEAEHQRQRWGTADDAGKSDLDWFWLLGHLGGKAVHNPDTTPADVLEKRLHRIVATAAVCANWHAQVLGKSNMRPGIEGPGDVIG